MKKAKPKTQVTSQSRAGEIFEFLKYKDWSASETLSALTYLGIQMAYSMDMPRNDTKRIYGMAVDLIYSGNKSREES